MHAAAAAAAVCMEHFMQCNNDAYADRYTEFPILPHRLNFTVQKIASHTKLFCHKDAMAWVQSNMF